MYINAKVVPDETIPGIRGGDYPPQWRGRIQV
jgi:hypothetical protein